MESSTEGKSRTVLPQPLMLGVQQIFESKTFNQWTSEKNPVDFCKNPLLFEEITVALVDRENTPCQRSSSQTTADSSFSLLSRISGPFVFCITEGMA